MQAMAVWLKRPHHPVLGVDEIHLWRANLPAHHKNIEKLGRILSPDERRRAVRYRFEKDRSNYIVARGLLKDILCHYLDLCPEEVNLRYGAHGKPELDVRSDRPVLRFNTSHSREWVLYAVTLAREVGVDVEAINARIDTAQLAGRFFSPGEVTALRQLPLNLQLKAFFDCWTRKEAYLKAKGVGLGYPLDRFEVALEPSQPAALICNKEEPGETTRWALEDVAVGKGYSAAVAIEGRPSGMHFWDCSTELRFNT